jgi:hypothetical protein
MPLPTFLEGEPEYHLALTFEMEEQRSVRETENARTEKRQNVRAHFIKWSACVLR